MINENIQKEKLNKYNLYLLFILSINIPIKKDPINTPIVIGIKIKLAVSDFEKFAYK